MRRPYSRYSADFRAGAVALVERGDRKGRAVAEDLGINDWTLRDWVRDHQRMKGSKNKSESPSEVPMNEFLDDRVQRLEREIAKRDKRVAQLEMDREILKKSGGAFKPRRKASETRVYPRGEGEFSRRGLVSNPRCHAAGLLRLY